jgi:hypothetical protein
MTTVSIDDVLASHAQHPNAVLSWSPTDFGDLKTKNKKAKFDVTWVNLKFKTAAGKKVPCRLKLVNQILSSGAKAPQTKAEDDISTFTVQFRTMLREDIEGGDYVARPRETEKEQEIENKRIIENVDEYLANNIKLIQVLDILNNSFVNVANEIIEADKKKTLKFTVRKDRKKKEITIFPLKQSNRYDDEKREDIPLDSPIFRIKLPVYKKDGRIGTWNSYKDQFRPTVYDARKMTKKNGYKPVAAYVKKGTKKIELNRKNVTSFITYKSLISGTVNFESATISKAGISLGNKFYEMYIVRHKSNTAKETVTVNEIASMRAGIASDDEGSDVDEEDVKKESDGDHTDNDNEGDQAAPDGDDTSDGEDLEDDAPDPDPDPDQDDEVEVIEKPKHRRKGASLKKGKKEAKDEDSVGEE